MPSLPFEIWTLKAQKHTESVLPYAEAFVTRKHRGDKHPVHDFLFTYYTCSPQKLTQWVPAFDTQLSVPDDVRERFPWLTEYWFNVNSGILSHNAERIPKYLLGIAQFVRDLCSSVGAKAPKFGCFGLHEWAMVYKLSQEEIRHNGFTLRLSQKELADFLESQTLCCTHYDAYRFFTKEAKPLNLLNPQLGTRLQMEQGGCVHANMDIYKWAVKLWPWIGSDFIGKAFLMALKGRELDMRASPYELSDLGYEPIRIETESGRKQYQKEQQIYFEESQPLREELLTTCQSLIDWLESRPCKERQAN